MSSWIWCCHSGGYEQFHFWDITLWIPVKFKGCFRRIYRPLLHAARVSEVRNHHEAGSKKLHPFRSREEENEANKHLKNFVPGIQQGAVIWKSTEIPVQCICWLSTDHTALYPRRESSVRSSNPAKKSICIMTTITQLKKVAFSVPQMARTCSEGG
jgi:hypothetical protein